MEKFIGKYKILREIGRGGMAVVYKAIDPKTQEDVALKVLLPSMVDRSKVERFQREAAAMARLNHPNILRVYDFGITGGNHYFAMEFIDGESLKTMIKHKGPFSVKETLDTISDAGSALAYSHSEGMIHRDIKSGNIMINKDGKVKVMDFGLVQIPGVTRVTAEGSAVGTAEYMSPEQVSDEEVDSRTDIYSLGVTMYEMLTGQPPFKADTLQAVMMKHKYETPPPMRESHPEIPAELERIVARAMAKDIAQRYQKVEELLGDINKLRGIQPFQERPKSKEQRAKSKDRRPKTKIIIGVIIIGFLVYFGYVYMGWKIKTGAKEKTDLIKETEGLLKKLELAEEHYNFGLKNYKDGFVDKAIAEYKKAINLRPDCPVYYKDLALAYEKKKENKKAIQAWQELLRYDQSGRLASMAREHLEKLSGDMEIQSL